VSASLTLGIETRPLERIEGDVLVVGLFEDDRPLRGGAARVDWRLCGQLSGLVLDERITGAPGDAVLLPSPGSVRAPRVLLLGLGDRRSFTLASARHAMQDATERCFGLGVRRIVSAPLGMAADDFARHAESVVQGLIDGLAKGRGATELILALPSSQADGVERALEAALLGRTESGVGLRARVREHSPAPNAGRGSAPRGITPPPV
jgi:leucyl aminopeptidase